MPEHKTESEASIEQALHAIEDTPFVVDDADSKRDEQQEKSANPPAPKYL